MARFLLAIGFVLTLLIEWTNPATLGNLSLGGKLLGALFNSVTPRTAGFNTLPTDLLRPSTLVVVMSLMFIGGSPASTAGGIKTTTVALVFLHIYCITKGKKDTEVFNRRITRDALDRALAILGIGISIIVVILILLNISEQGASFIEIAFEAFSAFGTVGLSIGLTAKLTTFGKIIIAFAMFFGRLGGLTIVFALAQRQHDYSRQLRYPEGKVTVG